MENDEILVISILSYYANQIFDGTKYFEFRKSPLRSTDLNKKFYVYSAKEDKAIIGTFRVSEILQGNTSEILKKTGYDVRNDKDEIIAYFGANSSRCFALRLYDVKRFERPLTLKQLRKVDPNIRLPQYYDRIKDKNICKLIQNYENKTYNGNFPSER